MKFQWTYFESDNHQYRGYVYPKPNGSYGFVIESMGWITYHSSSDIAFTERIQPNAPILDKVRELISEHRSNHDET